jgi:hypothetical protein
MTDTRESRVRRIICQVKKTWGELDHAQRRMFEIRSGVPVGPKRPNRRAGGHLSPESPRRA